MQTTSQPGHQMINCRLRESSQLGGRLGQGAGEAAPRCTHSSGAPSLLEAAAPTSTVENGISSYLRATDSLLLLLQDSPALHGSRIGQEGGKALGHIFLQLLAILITPLAVGCRQPPWGHCPVGDWAPSSTKHRMWMLCYRPWLVHTSFGTPSTVQSNAIRTSTILPAHQCSACHAAACRFGPWLLNCLCNGTKLGIWRAVISSCS